MIAADRSLQINTTRAATALNANIEILAPIQKSIASGTIVTGLGTGWYSCNVIPADPAILNLRGMSFEIKSTTPKDTVVTLELPYSKPSQGIIIDSRHLAKLFINLDIYVDSALVFYGLGVPKLSAKIPKPFQASASVTIDPGAQGGVLSYYFVVYRGKQRYSNESPDRWFQESIKPDQGLYSAQTERDSLFIPLGAKTKVYLHGYDAGGNLLDSLIKTKGSIKWSKSNVTPFTISDTNQLSIEVQMASKTKNLLRKADTLGWKISLEGRTLAGRLWITLDSVGTVNKLTLRSLLSSNRELVGTNHFSIQTDGFDTSLSPPLELVTNPSYTLIPKEAGKIEGSAVTLDSNFIGQVRIMARHKNKNRLEITAELFPDKDSLKSGLNIGKALAPGDKARDYFHDSYLQIKIPSGFVEEPSLLWLKSQRISSSFISKKNWQAVSQPIELSVQSGKPLLKSATISLSPSNATLGRELEIQAFDLNNLRWTKPPQDTVTFFSAFNRPSLSAQTLSSQNYVYTLFAKSLNLQALRFEIVPNPFSPLVVASQDGNTSPGARITLEVESPNAANILANLRIYNMAGELVRILLNHSTLAKQSLEIYWDGKTETGLWARNGRYILALKLDDGKNKHFQQRSIVLFR